MEKVLKLEMTMKYFDAGLDAFWCLVGNIFYWQRNKRKIWSVCFFLHFITYLGNILSKRFYSAKRRYAWHVCNLLGCNDAMKLCNLPKNHFLTKLIKILYKFQSLLDVYDSQVPSEDQNIHILFFKKNCKAIDFINNQSN